MIPRLFIALFLSSFVLAQTGAPSKESVANSVPTAGSETASTDPLLSAHAMLKAKKYKEASAAFQAIVDKNPASADAQAGLMHSLLRAHQVDEAERVAGKALTAAPSSALVHAAVGDVYLRNGELGEAEAEYKAALKITGNSARAWYGIGRIYDIVFLRRHAKEAFGKAHELDPEDEQIFNRWLDTLPYPEQLEELKKHAGDHPTEGQANALKVLAVVAKKKPFTLVGDVAPAEIKLRPWGRQLASVDFSANQLGARPVSKGFGVEVKFNDRTSAILLLDTGANGITIGRKLAEKIGVVKIADSKLGGIGDKGPVEGYVGFVEKISIGPVQFRDCLVEVSSRSDIIDEQGVFGPGIFNQHLITFDWKEQKMSLSPLPKNPGSNVSDDEIQDRYIAPGMQSFTKAYRFGDDHLFIPVVVSDKVLGTFLIDTGADLNLVSPRLAHQVTKTSNEGYSIKGVSGSVRDVLSGDKAILQFARMRVRSDDIPVIDLSHQSNAFGTEVAGLIGIRTLVQTKMTIDYRDGLVDFQVYEFKKARE